MTRTARGILSAVMPLCAVLLVAAAPAGARDGTERGSEWSASHPFREGALLRVENRRGSVLVTGVPGADAVEVRARKWMEGGAPEDSARVFALMEIRIEPDDHGGLSVGAFVPDPIYSAGDSWWDRLRSRRDPVRARVDLEILAPARCETEIRTVSGDAAARALEGPLRIETERGDLLVEEVLGPVRVVGRHANVTVSEIRGDLDVRVTTGEVEARRVGGALHARSSSGDLYLYDILGDADVEGRAGDVLVEECAGRLRVDAESGDVEAIRPSGDVEIRTGLGDVWVRVEPGKSLRYHLESEGGNLDLAVPGDWSARIDAETRTGAIQCFLPIELKRVSRSRLQGTAGNGDSDARLFAPGGEIRISRVD
ncbi:MAG: DUF4097 family beta strand repeat protein [Candidatus Eisenbacteria bacterium]|nr:DUF4097 family beta strand repeat protein [Candidatus Eisenbacteria bacterium]